MRWTLTKWNVQLNIEKIHANLLRYALNDYSSGKNKKRCTHNSALFLEDNQVW